jgi:hypothetical protein
MHILGCHPFTGASDTFLAPSQPTSAKDKTLIRDLMTTANVKAAVAAVAASPDLTVPNEVLSKKPYEAILRFIECLVDNDKLGSLIEVLAGTNKRTKDNIDRLETMDDDVQTIGDKVFRDPTSLAHCNAIATRIQQLGGLAAAVKRQASRVKADIDKVFEKTKAEIARTTETHMAALTTRAEKRRAKKRKRSVTIDDGSSSKKSKKEKKSKTS